MAGQGRRVTPVIWQRIEGALMALAALALAIAMSPGWPWGNWSSE
ncbi:MAG: hypothetical protein Q4G22_11385 [Paracoccus sp. (in: a-proteobacteria)]|nr:hypothetical protein [Paracoccus sp. (in: a-proteobacteria)]MDO5632424.1 hypothetical protein [Paracoccus sp. (in: a-proteobacteria)]